MKEKYTLIFFLVFISIKSQITSQEIVGDWTKVKMRTLDGSKDLNEGYVREKYYGWKITSSKLCFRNYPLSSEPNNCVDYTLNNNLLVNSPDSGYMIDKITSDSLIVYESIKGKTEKDKIQKIWFVKSSKILKDNIEKHQNDSVLIATPNFTPTVRRSYNSEIEKKLLTSSFPRFIAKGNILISPKLKKVEFQIDNKKFENDKKFLILKNAVENSFDNWDLTNFNSFSKIIIPLVFESMEEKSATGIFSRVEMYYFMDDVSDIPKVYGPKLEDLEKAREKFEKAIAYLKDKKYPQAIENFNKGFELNPAKVDALYNIVSIYSFLKDKENMCSTLKRLKDLEQTAGTKLYDAYCIK